MASRFNIGDAPRRREDGRFTTGQGGYLDDLRFDDLAHAVVLRSPHAHALIERIDAAAARGDARRACCADRRGCAGRWAAAHAADGGSQRADRRKVRLRTAAAAGGRQGAPCRRAGRADRRRDACAGARCGRTRGGRLPAAARRSPRRPTRLHRERRRFPPRCRAMSAWTGGGATRMPPMRRSQQPRMSFRFASTTTASSPIRWSRAARSACMTRRKAATRCMSPARISTATATRPPARSACRRPMCGSSRLMSAAGSARRISPTPSMR